MNKFTIGQQVKAVGSRGTVEITSIIEQAGFYFYNLAIYGGDQIFRVPENLLTAE